MTIKSDKEDKLKTAKEAQERREASEMKEIYGRDISWMSDESKYEIKQAMKFYTREKVLSIIDAELNFRKKDVIIDSNKKEEMISIPVITDSKPISNKINETENKSEDEVIPLSKIVKISQLISEILAYFPNDIREQMLKNLENKDNEINLEPKKLILTIEKYTIVFEYINKDDSKPDIYEFNCFAKRDEFVKNFSKELMSILLTENFVLSKIKPNKINFLIGEKSIIEKNLKDLGKILEDKDIFDKFMNIVNKSFEENDDIWVKNNSQDRRNDIRIIRDEEISIPNKNSIDLASVTTVIVSDIENENEINVLYICQNTEKIIYICHNFKDARSIQYEVKDMEKKPSRTFDSLRGIYYYLENEYDFKEVM